MAIPSEKYALDYTDAYGFKWSKTTQSIYPSLGSIDESIGLSRYNNDIVRMVYRKLDRYIPLYDDSITIGADTQANVVWKYYKRTSAPATDVNINTVILTGNQDGNVWSIGTSEEAANPVGTLNQRFLIDADYNKMLFRVKIRRFKNFVPSLIQPGYRWEYTSGSNWEDIDLKDINDDDLCALFSHSAAKVWNGSSWVDYSILPALICNGETVQSIQGAGSAFNNTYTNYYMRMGSGQNISLTANTSNNFYSGQNFANRMIRNIYSLGGFDSVDFRPDFASDTDALKSAVKTWIEENGTVNVNYPLSLERKIIDVNENMKAYVEVTGIFSLNNNHDLNCSSLSCDATPALTGKAIKAFIAGFGLYYLSDSNASLTGITPDNLDESSDIWLGEMNSDGTTSGNWIKGSDIGAYNGYNKDGSIINPDYDPSGGGGSGTDEDNNDPIPTVAAPYASGLARYYITTAGSLVLMHISEALGAWNLKDSGRDLYKNLISCKLIKPPTAVPSSSSVFEIYGIRPQYQGADITIPEVTGNPSITFGSYKIKRKFNDFRDYAPYTKVEIFLPYCGWTVLPSHVVGRSVSVTYYTDIIAATCKAVVYCGANVVAEAAGVIGLDIPMVAENAGAKAEAVTAGLLAYGKAGLQTALGVGAAVATKGKSGVQQAVTGIGNLISSYSQTALAFNTSYTEVNGRNGDGCCIAGISAIVIKITRPKYGANTVTPYVPAEYAHTIGFTSMKTVTVGSVTGLLIAENVDTSGIAGATERERQLIKLYLESGIIVEHPS